MVEDACKVLIKSHDGDENEIDNDEPDIDRSGAVEEADEGAGEGGRVVGEATKFQWVGATAPTRPYVDPPVIVVM